MTFRQRITLVATVAVAVAVLVASALTYLLVSDQLHRQVDSSLRDTASAVQRGVAELREPGRTVALTLPPGVPEGKLRQLFGAGHFTRRGRHRGRLDRLLLQSPGSLLGQDRGVVQLISPTGAVLVTPGGGSTALPVDTRARALARSGGPSYFSEVHIGSDHLRVLTAALPSGTPAGAIQIARSLNEIDHTLSNLRLILVLVTLGGIAVAALLGTLVSRAAVAPVRRLTDAAEHVAATQDLARRIPVGGGGELSRLAVSFNAMLDALARSMGALDDSVRAQRRLVADASHELRTPVTSLRANIEVLERAAELPDEDRERLLSDVVEQLEHMTALINDVIDLARGDEPSGAREEVRFDDVVAEAIERVSLHSPHARVEQRLSDALVLGDPTRLDRAVMNLLDNALKFSPPTAPVEVELHVGAPSRARGGMGDPRSSDTPTGAPSRARGASADRHVDGSSTFCELTVRDHGPGIDPSELDHVFDRFYRGASARATPGSGLGLAIVRQVAESHGGSVTAQAAPGGGTLMRLRLPLCQPGERLVDGHEPDLEYVARAAQV